MDYQALLKKAFLELKDMQAKLEASERARTEPIAIIGMGCRFPGGANDPESYWRILRDGVDAIGEVPADRWDAAAFYDPSPAAPGKIRTRWGGFLRDVDRFDAAFFGIAPREAEHMDPQQRLWLEVAWEAFEAAGQPSERLAGSRTGVFAAICSSDYMRLAMADPATVDAYDASGGAESIVANRLSYLLDLRGPSVSVDTACSSSLVAIHLACQSLRSRECEMALAGGVNLILSPEISISLSGAGMLAPDGRCKTFDARADGYVRGEGCGAVVLKRLPDAVAAGDPIRAVIRGSAVNQDGRSNGLTAPNLAAQKDVLRQALANAGVTPSQVSFIEAHGTGTTLGDPIEVEALTAVYGQPRAAGERCMLGAVKANLGHLEGAAGIAGLLKVALALEHQAIPLQLHFRSLNPNITLQGTPFAIPAELTPWTSGTGRRIAGLSSFGFGGTNAHIVLEEAPAAAERKNEAKPAWLLPISGRHPQALELLEEAYRGLGSDACYTASVRRSHHAHRAAITAEARHVGIASGVRPKTVFVFSGQGSQVAGMGRELRIHEPVFRQAWDQCDALVRAQTGWSISDDKPMDRTEFAQPAIVAVQIALAALWRSWGIAPEAVVGHSIGEIAAAHVAGVLTLADTMRIACVRGRLMQKMHGQGRMAAVELGYDAANAVIAGSEDRLAIAAVNAPTSVVLSGDPEALSETVSALKARGVRCRVLDMPYAFHSPQMRAASEELEKALTGLAPQTRSIPISGGPFNAAYWARQAVEPVRFADAISQLAAEGDCLFLELGGHPVLASSITKGVVLPSLRRSRGELASLYDSLGRLYTLGYDIRWSALYPNGGRCLPLPSYPWQRSRHWLPGKGAKPPAVAAASYLADHRIHGMVVVPMVVYLEMAWAEGIHALADVVVQEALVLKHDASLSLRFTRTGEAFQVESRDGDTWRVHASGRAVERSESPSRTVRPVLGERVDVDAFYRKTISLGFDFGPSFRGVRKLWRGGGEALGEVHLPEGLDASAYRIHPALLDACLQVVMAAHDTGGELYVPFGIDRLTFHERPGAVLWSHARMHAMEPPNPETLAADVRIFDSTGVVTAEIEGLRLKRASRDALVRTPDLYEVAWLPRHRGAAVAKSTAGRWLILADRQGAGAELALLLEARGEAVELLFAGAPIPAGQPWQGVIHLWSLDVEPPQDAVCTSLLQLVQSLTQGRIWVVTSGLAGAPLQGLGKVIALEHPELWGGAIESAPAALLLDEIWNPDGEDQVAFRNGQRHVARLVRSHAQPAATGPLEFRADGTYLVTGGTGGLGRVIARWLSDRGAGHVIAIGRQQADVTSEEDLSQLLSDIEKTKPPLRGVFHLAGVLDDGALREQTPTRLAAVLGPKVTGAWNLHRLTQGLPLDHFVLFSSGISLLGAEGQGSYAAANAFLDSLAHHRRSQGLPALGINWGPWAEAGMAAGDSRWRTRGVEPLSTQQGLRALEVLIQQQATQAAVLPARWPVYLERFGGNVPPFLVEVAEMRAAATPRIVDLLASVAPHERHDQFREHVRAQVARVLRIATHDLDNQQGFAQMGMDSLMAIELKNALQASLGQSLAATLIFDYPNLERLTAYLASEVLHLEPVVDEEPMAALLAELQKLAPQEVGP